MNDLDDLLEQILGGEGQAAGEGTDSAVWQNLGDAGLDRVAIAEQLGGVGGDYRDAAAIVTRAAEAGLAAPLAEALFPVAHLAAAAGARVPPGNVTAVVLEAGGRVDAADGYRVRTPGAEVAWGAQADELWVLAPGGGQAVLARLAPGEWAAQPGRNLAGEPRDVVRIDVVVPRERARLLPAAAAEDARLMSALGRSCQLLGAMRSCLRLCGEYALIRHQFGRPLAAHQAVRHALARIASDTAAAETAVSHAVGTLTADAGPLDAAAVIAIAAAKVQAARGATRVARAAHQLHGAVGLTAEHPLHHFTTRLWAWRDEHGGPAYWSERIGQIVHATYHDDLWVALTAQNRPAGEQPAVSS
jgi:acyl-CoA dehydrogenase